jgi:hypothetical protein
LGSDAGKVLATIQDPYQRPQIVRAQAINALLDRRNRSSIGGRVQVSSDPESTLRSYYKSLSIARTISRRHPEIAAAVMGFLDDVSTQGRHRALLNAAVEIEDGRIIEPAKPLGRSTPKVPQLRSVLGGYRGAPEWLSPTDPTIEYVLFGSDGLPKNLSTLLKEYASHLRDHRPTLLAVLRVYARAQEIDVEGMSVGDWSTLLDSLQNERETTGVLARLMKAYGADRGEMTAEVQHLLGLCRAETMPRIQGGPLGCVSRFDSEPTGIGGKDLWTEALQAADPEAYLVDDETIHRHMALAGPFRHHSYTYLEPLFLQHSDKPAAKLELFRICARVHALGYPNTTSPRDRDPHLAALPPTQQAADAVRYLASFEDWALGDVEIGGRRLSSFPSSRRLPPPDPDEPLGPPLGDLDLSDDEFRKRVGLGDREVLGVTDECIRRSLPRTSPGDVLRRAILFAASQESSERMVGALRLVARSLRIPEPLGDPPRLPWRGEVIEGQIQELFEQMLTEEQRSDPRVLEEVARIFRNSTANAYIVWATPNVRLAHFVPYVDAKSRLDQKILGAKAPVDQRVHQSQTGSPSIPSADEEAVCRFTQSGLDIENMLSEEKSPRAFFVAAEVLERCRDRASFEMHRERTWSYLKTAIDGSLVSEESIPWIVRLAKAFGEFESGFPPEAIRVRINESEAPIPLTRHPKFEAAMFAPRARVLEATRTLWDSLDPAQAKSDPERLHAMRRLIAGEDPPVELAQLLPDLVARAQSCRIERIHPSPEAWAAIGTWNHAGAVSILSALLTEASAEQIQTVLCEKGYARSLAKEWAEIAVQLRSLEPALLGYVLARIVDEAERPDFTTIPPRLDLARELDLGSITRVVEEDTSRAIECARALIERTLVEACGSEARSRALDLVDTAVERGLIAAEEMRSAARLALPPLDADAPEQWPLFAERIQPIFDDVASQAADARASTVQVEEAIDRLMQLADPAPVARVALRRAYLEDLRHVAPLGFVEDAGSDGLNERAIAILVRLASDPDEARADFELLGSDGLRLATEAADPEKWSEDAVVGLAAAAAAGWVPTSALAAVRDRLDEDLVQRAWTRVRSSRMRAVLEHRSSGSRIMATVAAPSGEHGAAARRGGPLSRVVAPAIQPKVEPAAVSPGPAAPTQREEHINQRFRR